MLIAAMFRCASAPSVSLQLSRHVLQWTILTRPVGVSTVTASGSVTSAGYQRTKSSLRIYRAHCW